MGDTDSVRFQAAPIPSDGHYGKSKVHEVFVIRAWF